MDKSNELLRMERDLNGHPELRETLQENMGHFSAAFTLDRYGHVTDTMRQNSAKRMQSFIQNLIT